MALAKSFVGYGFSPMQSQGLTASNIGTAVAAAGTTQGTATATTADFNIIASGGDGAGVAVYNGQIGDSQEFFNNQLTNLRIYPPTGSTINQIAANSPVIVPAYTYVYIKKCTATRFIACMSA